jgi:sec-independent protein translocase protein TatB
VPRVFDINGSEFLLLIVVAVIVVGPERLPRYAAQLGAWVRTLRGFLRTAKQRVDAELGDQAADVDWAALDPRRYDPRRIVREALLDAPPGAPGPAAAAAEGAAPGAPAPYDDEAT